MASSPKCFYLWMITRSLFITARSCLSLSKTTGLKNLEALAYACVGTAHSKLGEVQRGLEFHTKSWMQLPQQETKTKSGNAYTIWVSPAAILVTANVRLDTSGESLTVAENVGDKLAIGESHGGLGSVFYKTTRYPEAIRHNEKQLARAKEVKDKESQAKASGNLGNVYLSKGDYIKLLHFIKIS